LTAGFSQFNINNVEIWQKKRSKKLQQILKEENSMKRKLISLITVAVILTTMIACATEPEPTETTPTPAQPTITPEPTPEVLINPINYREVSFHDASFKYNEDYDLDKESDNSWVLTFVPQKAFVIISLPIGEDEGLRGHDNEVRLLLMDIGLDSFLDGLNDFQRLVKEELTISNVIARDAKYDFVLGNVSGSGHTLLFIHGNKYYSFASYISDDLTASEIDDYIKEFDSIIKSIILPVEPEPPEVIIPTVDEIILVDQNDVLVTLKSLEITSRGEVELNLLIENNSSDTLTIQVRDVSVNGMMFTSTIFSSSVTAGSKRNDSISFTSRGFERTGIDVNEIGSIELNFRVINDNNRNASYNTEQLIINTSIASSVSKPVPITKELLFEREGVSIHLIDIVEGRNDIDVVFYIVNDTERTITIQARDESVNGFMISGVKSTGVMPGKVAIDTLSFSDRRLLENGISGIDDIEVIKFVLRVIDENNRNATYNTPTIEIIP